MRVRNGIAAVAAVTLIAVAVFAALAFVGVRGVVPANPAAAKSVTGVRYLPAGGVKDAIDDPNTTSITLAQAEARAGTTFKLPPQALVGTISKIVMVGPDQPGGVFDMVVGYPSGLRVFVGSKRDIGVQFAQCAGSDVVFADGRQHVSRETLGVADAVAIDGGDQVLSSGAVNRVPTQIRWNDANYTYIMRVGSSQKTLSDLRSAVRGVR